MRAALAKLESSLQARSITDECLGLVSRLVQRDLIHVPQQRLVLPIKMARNAEKR